MDGGPRSRLPGGLHRMGPAARALLTFVALADAVLSLELWALHHHTAGVVVTDVLDVVAPVRPLAAVLDRNPALPASWNLAAALPLYREAARSGVAPFALMRDKRHVWASDRSAVLAVGCRTGVALALGPSIGSPDASARLHREFRQSCLARGWRPAFYQVPEETAAEMPGTRRILVGSEAIVDVEGFCLQGRAMANLRHQVTKARRLGVSAEVVPETVVPWDTLAAIRRLGNDATARSRLGDMSFSVGQRDDPTSVDRIFGLAFDEDRCLV